MAAQRGEKLKINRILSFILALLCLILPALSLSEGFELEIKAEPKELSLGSEKRDLQLLELLKRLSAKIRSKDNDFEISLFCENDELLSFASIGNKTYIDGREADFKLDSGHEIKPAFLKKTLEQLLSSTLNTGKTKNDEIWLSGLFKRLKALEPSLSALETREKRGAKLFDGEKKSKAQNVYSVDNATLGALLDEEMREMLYGISVLKPLKLSRHIDEEGNVLAYQISGEISVFELQYNVKLKLMEGKNSFKLEMDLSNKNDSYLIKATQQKGSASFVSSLEKKKKGERKELLSLNISENSEKTSMSFSREYYFKKAGKKSLLSLGLELKTGENKDISGEISYSNVKVFPHNIQTRQIINFPVKLHWSEVKFENVKAESKLDSMAAQSLVAKAFFKLLSYVPSENRAEILHFISSPFMYDGEEIASPFNK